MSRNTGAYAKSPERTALPTNAPVLLDTDHAAAYLGLSGGTISNWRVRGQGPPYLKFGSTVRYRQSDLDDFINRVLVQTKPVED